MDIVDGIVTKPSTNQIVFKVNQSDFENIASTEYIVLKALLKDNNTIVKIAKISKTVIFKKV
jgi:hypothetical protein